jgi:hypothetical protein
MSRGIAPINQAQQKQLVEVQVPSRVALTYNVTIGNLPERTGSSRKV